MSKLDAQRAMREAKYAARQAAPREAPGPTRRTTVDPSRAAKPQPATTPEGATAVSVPADDTCGHRSMNGRTCTRPAGHAEKNHRYG